jgi:CRISPR-associated protein Csb2
MLALEVRFPGRRFHATPWGRHVNEGEVEWPPSPWRLLRALLAVWYHKAYDEIPAAHMVAIVRALCEEAPAYQLPRSAAGHSRHYMPDGAGDTSLVFDTFLRLDGDAALLVVWRGVALPPEVLGSLRHLTDRVGYLGRAESWADVRVRERWDGDLTLVPCDTPDAGEEVARLLEPSTWGQYETFRAAFLRERGAALLQDARLKALRKGQDPDTIKALSAKATRALEDELPATLFDALQADTTGLRKAGWSCPPGARWGTWAWRAREEAPSPLLHEASAAPRGAQVARFAVASQAAPRLTEVLRFHEAVHSRLCRISHGRFGEAHPVFTGRAEDGRPREGHQHSFLLGERVGRHGHLTRLLVYAPEGFDDDAQATLVALREVHWKDHDAQLTLEGIEPLAAARATSALLGCAQRWVSCTPFVSPRVLKWTRAGAPRLDARGLQRGGALSELYRLLEAQGLPAPVSIEPLPQTELAGRPTRWSDFQTRRGQGGGVRGHGHGEGFRLCFDAPVQGPLVLGYGAHFGLGLFVPETP